jgi:hypothetical protein
MLTASSLALPLASTPLAPVAQDQSHGYQRTYTIQADAAWVLPGRLIRPAFITLDKGQIVRVSSAAPRETKTLLGATKKPRIVKVNGTLAASIVDAWSGLQIQELATDRHPMAQSRLADSLPADLPGGDLELASRIAAARDAGIAAIYLGRHDGQLQRGLGQAAFFSANDLPVLAGSQWLDLSASGSGLGIQTRAKDLRGLFESAVDWRTSLDDYQEKLEKYQESLEKYQEDLKEFIETKEKAEKEAEKSGVGRADDPKKDKGKDKDKEKDKDKRPKRPKRPSAPTRNAARAQVLDAIDGIVGVRVLANDAQAIRAAIDLQTEYDLNLLLIGGAEALAFRFELAEAGIGVVLDTQTVFDSELGTNLLQRFQGLREAGVDVALSSGGRAASSVLLTAAGELIAQGAKAEEVWASLTTVPAELLGLKASHGRISQGASGSMILFEGVSPFDASAAFRTHKPK